MRLHACGVTPSPHLYRCCRPSSRGHSPCRSCRLLRERWTRIASIFPLRQDLLVALGRETGLVEWTRAIDTADPVVVGHATLFTVSRGRIRALDAATGADLWSVAVEGTITAPLVWDSGWLIAIAEPGDVLAFRAADGLLIWRRALGAPSPHPAVPGGDNALYVTLADGRVVALELEHGETLWEQTLPGILSEPAAARDRVFVGSTDNFFYALDADHWFAHVEVEKRRRRARRRGRR